MLDTGFSRLVDHILDDRLVDDRQHLFRNGFRGGKNAGAETRNWKDGLANFLQCRHQCLIIVACDFFVTVVIVALDAQKPQ